MLDFLNDHQQPSPSWLSRITPRDVHRGPGPRMQRLLDAAIVYPGSGLDESPIRQMEGVAPVFLFLDHGVPLEDLRQAILTPTQKNPTLSTDTLVAMAEFDPAPFLSGVHLDAPPIPMEGPRHSYGFWAIFRRPGGVRYALLFFGAEAIDSLSALYPSTPPKGIVIQEHYFYVNPRGNWDGPLSNFAHEHWNRVPEWLILGQPRGQFGQQQGDYRCLGEDRAIESDNRDLRFIYRQL